MKAVAYNIKIFEKEYLAKANHKKHGITLISNPLTLETILYAEGKDAVIFSADDLISGKIIEGLATLGVKYLVNCFGVTDPIFQNTAERLGLLVISIPSSSYISIERMRGLAEQTISSLDKFADL